MSKTRSLLFLSCLVLAGTSILHATAAVTLNPTAVPGLTYVKGQPAGGLGASQTVNFIGTSNQFSIVSSTVPVWLTISPLSGLALPSPGLAVTFTANNLCVSLGSGLYKASVTVKDLATQTTLAVPVSVLISDPPPTLTIREGVNSLAAKTLVIGSTPNFTLTLVSSGAPVSFSISPPTDQTYTQSGSAMVAQPNSWMKILPSSGVAYSWGTPVTVSIDPSAWAQSANTGMFRATIQIMYGNPQQTLPLPFSVTVSPPSPAIVNFTPAMLPQVPVGSSATFLVNGSNFVPGLSTVALVTVATSPVTLSPGSSQPDFAYDVISPNAILVTLFGDGTNIAAGSLSTALALTGLTVTVTNPDTVPLVSTPQVLTITTAPIISSITSASSFLQAAPGGHPTVAPYDVISIFGMNLCRACGGAVVAQLTPTTPVTALRYPLSLAAGGNYVQVYFVKHADNTVVVGQGYLLFAANTQINVLVPAAVTGGTTSLLGAAPSGFGQVDVLVYYGASAAGSVPATTIVPGGPGFSLAYNVVVAAYNPGVFTVDSTGVGQGAILNSDNSLNGDGTDNGVPAAKGGIIQIFMTGLGIPDSTNSDATTSTPRSYPTTGCLAAVSPATAGGTTAAPGSYLAAVNTTATTPNLYAPPTSYVAPSPLWTTLDGALIQSSFIPDLAHHFAPCLKTPPTVMIGGRAATVAYAGWTTDSVVGLYQINVTIPLTVSSGDNQVLVTIGPTANPITSQSGVTVNVQ
jgi:hypothetical protein